MNRKALFLSLLTMSIALAGCASNDGGSGGQTVDPGTVDLGDKGGIAGLLVDDRFRPIHLTDDPTTEFDATGFILLQETGQQVQTTINGEFQFLDLEPGEYTLRTSADGHEATPTRVRVAAGEFSEETIVARRVLSEGGLILTQEFTIWSDCWAELLVLLGNELNCWLDYSGDSLIGGFGTSFAEVKDDLTYLVVESLVDRDGTYTIVVGVSYDGDAFIDDSYGRQVIEGSDYSKITLQAGNVSEEFGGVVPMDLDFEVLVTNFPQGQLREPTRGGVTIPEPVGVTLFPDGVPLGAGLPVKTKVLMSAFLSEPEVDLEAYCVLCE